MVGCIGFLASCCVVCCLVYVVILMFGVDYVVCGF